MAYHYQIRLFKTSGGHVDNVCEFPTKKEAIDAAADWLTELHTKHPYRYQGLKVVRMSSR